MAVKELDPPFKFASWSVPQFARAIEYPLEVMEEIRAFACDELLRLSHGGGEVGGVLFGTRRDDLIRVLTWRPIACEHVHGESFVLSYNDRMNLAVQLEAARNNQDLKDLRPVGWFVSRQSEIVRLSESDLSIYDGFFPESWQVVLVICPKENGNARAGYFAREADGKVNAESSYHCFDLRPSEMASEDRKMATASEPSLKLAPSAQLEDILRPSHPESYSGARSGPQSGLPAGLQPHAPVRMPALAEPAAAPASQPSQVRLQPPEQMQREFPEPSFALPSFQVEDRLPTKERWLWAIPIVLALGIAAFMLYQRRAPSGSALAFRALSEAQTVQLSWDTSSRVIRDSYRGEVDITDAGKTSQISLTADQLHAGKMSYLPQSGDVGFAITVYPTNGDPVHDTTRLIAPAFNASSQNAPTQPPQLLPQNPPPAQPVSAPSAASHAPSEDQSALEQQIQQLRAQLGKEKARADESQNLVRILENRLAIQQAAPKQ
jgi:hypothetical protein